MAQVEDLTGMKFNRLLVLYKAADSVSKNGAKRTVWHCLCDCGKETDVKAHRLKSGHTKSCGCLALELILAQKYNKKYNTYDLSGEYGIGYTSKGEEFYFDLEDYDKIKDICWHKKQSYKKFYMTSPDGIKMHRLIMDVSDRNIKIDHINHNTCDNRKCNLRPTTNQENSFNHAVHSNNTSGFSGVCYCKDGRYRSYIYVNGKRIDLGSYKEKEDAIAARKAAEEEYFGEWSYDNSQKIAEQYIIEVS